MLSSRWILLVPLALASGCLPGLIGDPEGELTMLPDGNIVFVDDGGVVVLEDGGGIVLDGGDILLTDGGILLVDGGGTLLEDGGIILPDGGTNNDAGTSNDGGPPIDSGTNPNGLDARPANTTCVAPAKPIQNSGATTQLAFANLTFNDPMLLVQAPGDSARVFLMERNGDIKVFPKNENAVPGDVKLFLTITVNQQGEGGLLGMAFHPNWAINREVFISYTETGPNGSIPLRSVISRFKSTDNGLTLDPASEEVLLKLDQPYDNHNGGNINFGPDGYLYIGFGDGGSGGDPQGFAQKLNTILGKFIRIDVNVPFSQKYAIPPTNPFAATGAACNRTSSTYLSTATTHCAEIYAIGIRNPWRWSFDQGTGDLWLGDVGQNAYEEIDKVVLGGNYGWNTREGLHCYNASTCPSAGFIDPLWEYGRSEGVSITGGYVYRGTTIPSLVGKFIYGDYGSGRIWALTTNATTGAYESLLLQDTNLAISSFGQTHDGEVYVCGFSDGKLYKLVPQGAAPSDPFPQKLSTTGCFKALDPKVPSAGMIPYDLNAALWSDGASKERYFAIPDGTKITVGSDGDWTFPNGSVLAKTFSIAGKRIETRLFMRHSDGSWAGYSYEWDDAQTDATLLPAQKSKTVGSQTWYFPSRAQCLTCHTAVAGRTLGPETGQLNREILYPATGRTRNQLTTLNAIGMFAAPLGQPAASLPVIANPYGTDTLDHRARAYLHANCSNCHRSGAGQGPADWRYTLTLSGTMACNASPQNGSLGVTNAKLIAPGNPSQSIVSVRMHALNANRMPPLGTSVVDTSGTALIDSWITGLTGCTP